MAHKIAIAIILLWVVSRAALWGLLLWLSKSISKDIEKERAERYYNDEYYD